MKSIVAQESSHCIYCKKELNELASEYELQNQVHFTCESAIDYYGGNRGKLPDEKYADLQKFFKKYDIVQYRYLTNKELYYTTRLNLNDKKIGQIPESIKYLSNLRELALAGNNLQELPQEIGLLDQLEMINLSYNKFDRVPEVIKKLVSLKKFFYKGNNLTTYPEVLKGISDLEEIDVSHNYLKSLPEEITRLKGLEVLRCKNNKLKNLPTTMNTLKKLRILDLSHNNLKNIPYWVEQKKFYYINLTNNPIEQLEEKLKKLQALLLHGVVVYSNQ